MDPPQIKDSFPGQDSILDRLKTIKRNPVLMNLQKLLREINAWEDPQVQRQYLLAKVGTDFTRPRALQWLMDFIQNYYDINMQLDDAFMPYGTADQISNNGAGIHILDQAYNNIPMYAPFESLPLCWLILGPQGAGKSSAAFNILRQLDIPFLILDPKGTWRFRARQLNAKYIDAELVSLDLSPPMNVESAQWLYAYMEGVAYVTGLQYGLSCLYEACNIAIEQQKRYTEQTGQSTSLCLKDIYMALQICTSRNSKQAQYLESAKTALQLLISQGELFANRGGLPLEQLLNGNYILGCRYATSVQSRLLGLHILTYEYYRSYKLPETTQPRGVIVFDDSSKFISRPDNIFGSRSTTSAYLHVLSTLRSTGKGAIFIDQLVEPICDDVKQLCNNWLIVGGMRGTHNQNEVASAMTLTKEQTETLGKLQKRESICFCPTLYPRPVHGLIPVVPVPDKGNNQ